MTVYSIDTRAQEDLDRAKIVTLMSLRRDMITAVQKRELWMDSTARSIRVEFYEDCGFKLTPEITDAQIEATLTAALRTHGCDSRDLWSLVAVSCDTRRAVAYTTIGGVVGQYELQTLERELCDIFEIDAHLSRCDGLAQIDANQFSIVRMPYERFYDERDRDTAAIERFGVQEGLYSLVKNER